MSGRFYSGEAILGGGRGLGQGGLLRKMDEFGAKGMKEEEERIWKVMGEKVFLELSMLCQLRRHRIMYFN